MNNIIVFLVIQVICYALLLAFYRLWGREGVFGWIAIASVMGNIACNLVYCLGPFEHGGGCAPMASVFLATDILAENHGREDARKGAYVSIASILAYMVLAQLALLIQPAASDWGMEHFRAVLKFSPRFSILSVVAVAVSGMLDVALFSHFKGRDKGDRLLWLRNNVSTMASQVVDNVLFMGVAYIGLLPFGTILRMILMCTIVEFVSAILDTPFMYAAKYRLKEKVVG